MTTRQSVIVVLTVVLATPSVAAQNVGDSVRVTTTADTVIGVVSETNEHGLVLALNGGVSREFAHVEIQRLERHTGDTDFRKDGAAYGFLAALPVVWLTGEKVVVPDKIGACLFSDIRQCGATKTVWRATDTGYWALVVGSTVGFFVGRSIRKAQWETVPHPARLPLSRDASDGNPNRSRLNPMVGVRQGPDGSAGVVLGIRVRF